MVLALIGVWRCYGDGYGSRRSLLVRLGAEVESTSLISPRRTGLDAAPVVVPSSVLPYEYSSRLSFVQHNVLKGLPFDDGRLDLVRISSLFSSIPGEFFGPPLTSVANPRES